MADLWTIIGTVAGTIGTIVAIFALFNWGKVANRLARQPEAQRLIWDDIVDGRLHDSTGKVCAGSYTPNQLDPCPHVRSHATGDKKCWNQNLAVLFNKSWARGPDQRVRKPRSLNDCHEYIQTDSSVILAYLLCTRDGKVRKHLEKIDLPNHAPGYHISGELNIDTILTKREARCLIAGYPPWYREVFDSVYGFPLSYPLKPDGTDEDGIWRAGWVLALGFQKPPRYTEYLCPIHDSAPFHLVPHNRDPPQSPSKTEPYHIKNPLQISVTRTIAMTQKLLDAAFPNNKTIRIILDAMKTMDRVGYADALITIEGVDMSNWYKSKNEHGAGKLTPADADWAMEFFNRLSETKPLEQSDIDKAKNIIDQIVIAAFQGVSSVIRYMKLNGREFQEEKELRDIQKKIWLRGCVE